MTVLTDDYTDEELDFVDTGDDEFLAMKAQNDAARDFMSSLPETKAPTNASAPHGYKANGEIYKRCHKLCANHKSGQSKVPKAPSKSRGHVDYTESLNGLFQLAAFPLAFVAAVDSWAITAHAPGISSAVNDLAQQRPEVAAVLDRVLQVGPYGALIAATVPLIAQLLTNHMPKLIPPGFLGTNSKEDILAHLQAEAEGLAREE